MGKSKIAIIIGREFFSRVKKKSFILTTLLPPILLAALMVVPSLIAIYGGSDDQKTIVVVDNSGFVLDKLDKRDDLVYVESKSKDIDELKKNLKDLDAYAFMVISPLDDKNNVDVTFYSEKKLNMDTQNSIAPRYV